MIIAMVLAAVSNRCFCSSVSNRGTNLAEISRTYKYSRKNSLACSMREAAPAHYHQKYFSLFFSDDIANSPHVSFSAGCGGTTLDSRSHNLTESIFTEKLFEEVARFRYSFLRLKQHRFLEAFAS